MRLFHKKVVSLQRFCIIFKFSIMPRKPRESSGTGIYHVMLRGINRQDIFDDTEDYWTFIKMMSAVPCYIYAYCLMPNHVHLLIAVCTRGQELCVVIPH